MMFWNDIREIQDHINTLSERLLRVENNIEKILLCTQERKNRCTHKEAIEETLETVIEDCFLEVFESEDEFSSINRIHEKLDSLVKDVDRKQDVVLSLKILEKFDDYMKNIDKLNAMVNEFKGCVAMVRGAIKKKAVSHDS